MHLVNPFKNELLNKMSGIVLFAGKNTKYEACFKTAYTMYEQQTIDLVDPLALYIRT